MKNNLSKKLLLLSIISLIVLNCFSFHVSAGKNTINIICANAVLADFTSNLIKENVTIQYIMPSGACPSHFDICPSDVSLISSAEIIVSLGYEPWLDSLQSLSGNKEVKYIKCLNLGEWNLPSNAIKYVEKIRKELMILLPEKNTTIYNNAKVYLEEINETSDRLKNLVTQNISEEIKLVSIEWQKYFLEWLGFNVTYSYQKPESLSLQDEIEVLKTADNEKVYAIIDNLQSGTDFGARIALETGKSHVILTNFPGAIPNTDTYLDMITYNTEQVLNGIQNYDYKKGEIDYLKSQIDSLEIQRNSSIVFALIAIIMTLTFFIMYKRK